jgi:hypothetical protein
MFPEHWTRDEIIEHALREILVDQKRILEHQENQMSALTDLQTSVNKLQSDVNAFIAANSGGATDTQLVALKTQVDAIDAVINPPAPAPTPAPPAV